MSILLVIGSSGPIPQTQTSGWSYPTAESAQQTYKGVYANVKALYDSYKAVAGSNPSIDSLQLHYERGMGTLTVSTVEDGPVQYELIANTVNMPIYGHSHFTSSVALTAPEIHAVQVAYQIGQAFNPARYDISDVLQPYPFDGSAFDSGRADTKQADLYGFISRGVESYNISAYVLRQSQNVSKRSAVTASYANVNRVEAPPNTSAVNTLIGAFPGTGEWLKQSPNVRMYGNKKWQITQEWWWAPTWSSLLYGGSGTP